MPHNLVEVDEFNATVPVPSGGDARNAASVETPFQRLANRTRNLLNRVALLETCASFTFSGSGIANGAKCTLTADQSAGAAFTLASNEVTFPSLGKYAVALSGFVGSVNSVTNPLGIAVGVKLGVTLVARASGLRFSATPADYVGVSAHCVVNVTDLADKLTLFNGHAFDLSIDTLAKLVIRRIA